MKFTIEIDIPEVTDEWIEEYVESNIKYQGYVESKTVSRFNEVKYLVDNPYNIITEISNQINSILIDKVNRKTGKTVSLVEEGLLEKAVEEAKAMLEKKSTKKLMKEYLKTFIGNPTPFNYICFTCGRAEEMKR